MKLDEFLQQVPKASPRPRPSSRRFNMVEEEHLMWVGMQGCVNADLRQSNAVSWRLDQAYTKQLAQTGVNGLELIDAVPNPF